MAENIEVSEREITILLEEFSKGNKKAFNRLFPIVYHELRRSAHNLRIQFFNLETLNTTAIVHETYLKILRSGSANFKNRSHFYFLASRVIRQILVNASLKKQTLRRGGNQNPLPLDDIHNSVHLSDQTSEELIVVNDALEKLENVNGRQAKIVECRFFGGMTVEETATALDISPATVKRSWIVAKTWLYNHFNYG